MKPRKLSANEREVLEVVGAEIDYQSRYELLLHNIIRANRTLVGRNQEDPLTTLARFAGKELQVIESSKANHTI